MMIRGLLGRVLRLFPASGTRGEGQSLDDRELDNRLGLVDGKPMTRTGKVVDFEADSKPPKY